jgi:hypothetical protein
VGLAVIVDEKGIVKGENARGTECQRHLPLATNPSATSRLEVMGEGGARREEHLRLEVMGGGGARREEGQAVGRHLRIQAQ